PKIWYLSLFWIFIDMQFFNLIQCTALHFNSFPIMDFSLLHPSSLLHSNPN
uniref:Uncharacterized protein n=1 Tax=Aegilops tauschii subsp. strangulata TaxID=200361 RepID=A0A453RTK2_AEGTS